MKYIEAPLQYQGEKETSLFLAGGITGCPDWQKELVDLLKDEDLILFNPRRTVYPTEEHAVREQIQWEHTYLRYADAISFWFPKETLCPITLYELGAWSMTEKPLFVGVHPEYQRKEDVEIQTAFARPDVEIVYDLHALGEQIQTWNNEKSVHSSVVHMSQRM